MKFRKIPTLVDAVQFTGHNDAEVLAFCPTASDPQENGPSILIQTPLMGGRLAKPGDWVVKDEGEFYPCSHEVFLSSFEEVKEPTLGLYF